MAKIKTTEIKRNTIHYGLGDIPYVWMVRTGRNVNLFFEEKNARKRFEERLNDYIACGCKVLETENYEDEGTYVRLEDKNCERFTIWVVQKRIIDYKEY